MKIKKTVSSLVLVTMVAPCFALAAPGMKEVGGRDSVRIREVIEKQQGSVKQQRDQMASIDVLSRILIETKTDLSGSTANSLRALIGSPKKVLVKEADGSTKEYSISDIITKLSEQSQAVSKTGSAQQKKEMATVVSFLSLMARTSKSPQKANFLEAFQMEAILTTDVLNNYKGVHRAEHLREMAATVEVAAKNPNMPAEMAYEEGLVQTAQSLAKDAGKSLSDVEARKLADLEADRKKKCQSKI